MHALRDPSGDSGRGKEKPSIEDVIDSLRDLEASLDEIMDNKRGQDTVESRDADSK